MNATKESKSLKGLKSLHVWGSRFFGSPVEGDGERMNLAKVANIAGTEWR
jgi:hypothetical protein